MVWTRLFMALALAVPLVPGAAGQHAPLEVVKDATGDHFLNGIDIASVRIDPTDGSLIRVTLITNQAPNVEHATGDYYVRFLAGESPTAEPFGTRCKGYTLQAAFDASQVDSPSFTFMQGFHCIRSQTGAYPEIAVKGSIRANEITWEIPRSSQKVALPDGPTNLTHVFAMATVEDLEHSGWVGFLGCMHWSAPCAMAGRALTDRAPDEGYGLPVQVPAWPPASEAPTSKGVPADPVPEFQTAHVAGPAVPAFLAASLGVMAATWIARRGVGATILWPLFSRLDRDAVLRHPRRQEILEFIEQNPGASFGQIRSGLGIGSGSLAHHLGILVSKDVLRRRAATKGDRFYTPSQAMPVQADDVAARALLLIRSHPGIRQADLARALQVSPQRLRYHLASLVARHDVVQERKGRHLTYRLDPIE